MTDNSKRIQEILDYANPNWPSGHWRKRSAALQFQELLGDSYKDGMDKAVAMCIAEGHKPKKP